MDKYEKSDWGMGVEKAITHELCNIANELARENALKALEMEYSDLDEYSHEEYSKLIQAIMK